MPIQIVTKLFVALLFCYSALALTGDELPTELRTLFNHGAELAATGELDKAAETLRLVAIGRDRTVAAKALSLLGQIAVNSAKQHVAEKPAETLPVQRLAIFEHLKSAEQSFTESLLLQPNDEVRRYLETLRTWRYNMANAWEKYDREQLRNAELQERIRHLADWEEKLTEKILPLLDEPNSPRKFQVGYEAGKEQQRLAEELEQLQEVHVDDAELAEQWVQLPKIQKIADESAKLLTSHRTEEALPKQQQVLDYLRSLLKQEESPPHQQDQENQEPNQEGEQDQQSPQQDGEPKDDEEQESERNQSPSMGQESNTVQEESPEERAERLLMQVRRKEQAVKEARDRLRALLIQAEAVEKDW